mmetsp:Transcript_18555/g.27655  ORF Transcript_18555/g.27655 Transcript_18555/m.27655 type:complete len:158 (-) Transcript_18555:1516-1989(-)
MRLAENIFSVVFILCCLSIVWGHCQQPCGIYDDDRRVELLKTSVATIRKSVDEFVGHFGWESAIEANQAIRWILQKEKHADLIINELSEYWLLQRIKDTSDNYGEQLKVTHQLMVQSMKVKQTATSESVVLLENRLSSFIEQVYPSFYHHHEERIHY